MNAAPNSTLYVLVAPTIAVDPGQRWTGICVRIGGDALDAATVGRPDDEADLALAKCGPCGRCRRSCRPQRQGWLFDVPTRAWTIVPRPPGGTDDKQAVAIGDGQLGVTWDDDWSTSPTISNRRNPLSAAGWVAQ